MQDNTKDIEIWNPVVEFEGLYEVSTFGRVKSIDHIVPCKNGSNRISTGKILELKESSRIYFKVALYKNGKPKSLMVHRIEAIAFIPNPDNKPFVNHKDGNKLNNYLYNLEWSTVSENTQHSYDNGLQTPPWNGITGYDNPHSIEVFQFGLKGNFITKYGSVNEAYRKTGIHSSSIGQVCLGRRLTAGGFKWSYVEIV